jgi:aminoglycoside phosphotransferase (APT) family kinase protein
MSIVVRAPRLAELTPIIGALGLASPLAVTDIKDGAAKIFRIDLADGTAVVLRGYDAFHTGHHVVAGETFASRLLDGLDLPVTRYLAQDETCSRLPFPFAITNYLPGVTVKSLAGASDIADAHRRMGALLRRLHSVRLPAFGQFGPDGVRDPVVTNAEQMRRSFAHAFAQFRKYGGDEDLAIKLEAIVADRFDAMTWSRGAAFAHDDLNPNNVLVERGPDGGLRLSGLIDFGNARAADAVSDLAKSLFNTEHEMPGSTAAILEGYGPIDHPDPPGALWFYTLYHRVVMWWWLRHVGVIPDSEKHDLIRDLEAMVDEAG